MCDSLVARGRHSADGATLFAKNSDRNGRETQPFVQFPAAFHSPGSQIRCTHTQIDQVAETYRVMGHSPVWCWGFEHGVNEYGVAIGNHATWSRVPLESGSGLIGMDLVRLGLERGRDAREALEIIASLVETHGQGGSAFAASGDQGYQNSFMIADGHSAWIFETTDREWAARAVESGGLTNRLSLGSNWQIGSRNLERYAQQNSLWPSSDRLDFKAAYAREDWPGALTAQREEAVTRVLAGPPLTVASMKEWLRDHGTSALPPDSDRNAQDPARYSICMHADPLSMTTASMVARLPEEVGARPWPVWISFATPCTGIFLPVYLDAVIPQPLASSAVAAEAGNPLPGVWDVLRRLQESASRDFVRSEPILAAGWGEVEAEIERNRLRVEEKATELYAGDQTEEAQALLSSLMAESVDAAITAAERMTRRFSS